MQPRPFQYDLESKAQPGSSGDPTAMLHDELAIAEAKVKWDMSPLRTPVPGWLVHRFARHKTVNAMQTAHIVQEQLYQALCVKCHVPAPLASVAAWITVRVRLLSPSHQQQLVTKVCQTDVCTRHFRDAQPYYLEGDDEWGVAFTDENSRVLKLSLADFFADYVTPLVEQQFPPLQQREQKDMERRFAQAARKAAKQNQQQKDGDHQARINAAHAQLRPRLDAMEATARQQREQAEAQRRAEQQRAREAQRQALDEEAREAAFNWLANHGGAASDNARLSRDLQRGVPENEETAAHMDDVLM